METREEGRFTQSNSCTTQATQGQKMISDDVYLKKTVGIKNERGKNRKRFLPIDIHTLWYVFHVRCKYSRAAVTGARHRCSSSPVCAFRKIQPITGLRERRENDGKGKMKFAVPFTLL